MTTSSAQLKSSGLGVLTLTLSSAFILGLTGCGQTNSSSTSSAADDSSVSGAAAGAAGGALSSSSSSGMMAQMKLAHRTDVYAALKSSLNPLPEAMADSLCPTFKSTSNLCTTSGSAMWLQYNACTFQGKLSWTGVQEISMSTGSASCGTFPNPGANGMLYRQFVSAANSSTAGSATITYNSKTMTIDDSSANLSNFDGDTIAAINTNGGYGSSVSFDSSGKRTQVVIGHHISVAGAYNHSLSGTLSLSESSDGTSRTVNGPLNLYHNLLKVVATSQFTDVVHNNTCCLPVSGTITTTFAAGNSVSPTNAGSALIGKTETLKFNGCGSATLTGTDGTSSSVTLSRCF